MSQEWIAPTATATAAAIGTSVPVLLGLAAKRRAERTDDRRHSGEVHTSDAEELWEQVNRYIERLEKRLEIVERREQECMDRQRQLEAQIDDLRRQVGKTA